MKEISSLSPRARASAGVHSVSLHRALWFAVGGIALAAGALAGYAVLRPGAEPLKFNARDVTGVPWGKDFQLTDHAVTDGSDGCCGAGAGTAACSIVCTAPGIAVAHGAPKNVLADVVRASPAASVTLFVRPLARAPDTAPPKSAVV